MRSPIINLPSKLSLVNKRKQKGAVAIIFGLTAAVLLSMGGLVVDMGHLFIAKTELQNAADAAALAGARRLDETAAGITNARNDAITIAALNRFNFATPVVITEANTEFSSNPAGPWLSYATALASPTGMTFVRVNTGARTLDTYLMSIAEIYTVSTFGLAVAGRFVNNVTPIGVCAIKDPVTLASRPKGEALLTGELAQFGFRRGVSYNIFNLGPLGGPSDTYLLDPVDAYPNPCTPANSSANTTAPFICNGASAILTTTPGTVYGNTGISAGKIEAALNSRFDNFLPPSVCIPAQAPPDVNVQAYGFTSGVDWMTPTPTVQTIAAPGMPIAPATIASADKYGVLWSYSRAVNAVGTTPNATPGAAFATTDWATLYPPAPATNGSFPAAVSPYLDPAHVTAPTVNPGVLNRRVLNMAIADCPAITGSGGCQVIPILGIGRFFMQVPADFSGTPKKLEVEFAGLIEPVPVSEIKLYR
jgi:Flp pilus assembly protein TadG